MCCGSEAGSYLRLIDFVYHSTLGLRVIKKKRRNPKPVNPKAGGTSGVGTASHAAAAVWPARALPCFDQFLRLCSREI